MGVFFRTPPGLGQVLEQILYKKDHLLLYKTTQICYTTIEGTKAIRKEIIGMDKELLRILGYRDDFDWDNRFDLKTTVDDFMVSTVDLGLDHSFGTGRPLYYETMIFLVDNTKRKDNPFEYYQIRYSTEEEARAGHDIAIELVKEYLKGME